MATAKTSSAQTTTVTAGLTEEERKRLNQMPVRNSSGISTGVAGTGTTMSPLRDSVTRSGNVSGATTFMQGINSQNQLEQRLAGNVANQTSFTPEQLAAGAATQMSTTDASKAMQPIGESADTVFGETPKEPTTMEEALTQTREQKAESQFEGEFKKLYEDAKKFGYTLPFSNFTEYKNWKNTASQADMDYLLKQQGIQRELEGSQSIKSAKDIEGAIAGTEAAMAQSREGVMSSTKPQVVSQFTTEMNRQKQQIELERTSAENQRQEALRQLKLAQDTNNIADVEAWQGRISQIEDNIRQIDAQAMQAATQANQQAMAAMDAFSSQVAMGIVMTPEYVMGLAPQLGLDSGTLWEFYKGAENIRNDKSLDAQGKQMALDMNQQALTDAINGVQTAEAKNIQYLNSQSELWKSQGLSTAEIEQRRSELRQMMGIENEKDPGYIADLNYKNAQLAYQNSATAKNYQDLLGATAEYNSTYGGGGGYVPSDSKYAVSMTVDASGNPMMNVAVKNGQTLDIPGTSRREDYCGAFVNDVLGVGMGDLYTQKVGLITSDIPEPGMAFVQATADKYGHTGIVESVDLANGTMQVVEANWQKGSDGKGIISRRTMNIADATGFVKPQNSVPAGGGYSTTQENVLNSLSGIDPKDIDTTTLTVLSDAGLTSTDLLNYKTQKPVVSALAPDKQSAINDILAGINELQSMDMSGAVGFGWQKLLGVGSADEGFINASDAADFKAKFDTFRDNLVLPSLDKLKGAMSDKDIAFLRNAATALSLTTSEKAFKAELDKLEKKYTEILSAGTSVDPAGILPQSNLKSDPLGLFN